MLRAGDIPFLIVFSYTEVLFHLPILSKNYEFFTEKGARSNHVALIFDSGSVYDFEMNGTNLVRPTSIMNMSRSKDIFGYSDDLGRLYFVPSENWLPITR